MKTILNFPDRGHWGNSDYRGNCSGHIQKSLIQHFNPKLFVDICEGSGTSRDVCKELKVEYVGLDIKSGFDFTSNEILSHLPKPADLVFSHPPYHSMIQYSSLVNDISNCKTVDEYLAKSQLMLFNQREATERGGIYCTLIGDHIQNGVCNSYQAEFIKMMPKNELHRVMIKLQHNCHSSMKQYKGNFIETVHEYLILWKKRQLNYWEVCIELVKEADAMISNTWRNALRVVMLKIQKGTLAAIYIEVTKVASNLIAANPNWKAKVRQILQKYHKQIERGVWTV